MSFDTLIEKFKSVEVKKQEEKAPKRLLCSCELYETGPEDLLVTLWHPTGVTIFAPSVKTNLRCEAGSNRPVCHEVHSSKKIIGCHLNYLKYSLSEMEALTTQIYVAWEKM